MLVTSNRWRVLVTVLFGLQLFHLIWVLTRHFKKKKMHMLLLVSNGASGANTWVANKNDWHSFLSC